MKHSFNNKIVFLYNKKRRIFTDWDKLYEDIKKEFPYAPFYISCIDDLNELDEIFTEEKEIVIHDDRASGWYFDDIEPEERVKYFHYTVIKQIDNEPITLRQVLATMINDNHYHNDFINNDPHNFLEGFKKHKLNNILYSTLWGS